MNSVIDQCIRKSLLKALVGLVLSVAIVANGKEAFIQAKLTQIENEVNHAIEEHKLPGGVLWIGHQGTDYHKAFGMRALWPNPEPMTEDTIFDIASLTKVLATTPALMILYERGAIRLDAPVATYLPEFGQRGKETITLKQLMTHTSGLGRTLRHTPDWSNFATAFASLCAEPLPRPAGTAFLYSDINFIILGEVIRRVSGMKLEEFAAREIFEPLKMTNTCFLPSPDKFPRIAPTEKVGGEVLRGKVHDPKARAMGGVAGHAGVFTTAADMARFVRMMLEGGKLDEVRILKPETVALMTQRQTPESVKAIRGLGWDIDSDFSRPRGELFPIGSYGHTGFTGVCLWVDPGSGTFWIFLTNRVHPNTAGNIYALQKLLGTLSAEATRPAPSPVPSDGLNEPARP